MSANYVTDCVHVSFYLRLYLQLLKTPLCKNLGVKKLLDFAGKRPWLQARSQQLPALKSYLELWYGNISWWGKNSCGLAYSTFENLTLCSLTTLLVLNKWALVLTTLCATGLKKKFQ